MIKKFAFFCVLILAILRITAANASVSSILIDAANGDVMYEMNADERRYPASLTKLMTLYITFNALENNHIKLTDKLKVSRTAAGRSPSKLGVHAGETITVKDAIMAAGVSGKLGALMLKPVFKELKGKLDQSQYGGAVLLGAKAPVVKAHGASDAKTVYYTLKQIREIVAGQVVEKFSAYLEQQRSEQTENN